MKETIKMSRAICLLEKMYNTMNADFFNGNLPVPIITCQSKPGSYGHCSVKNVWKRKDETTYEMNIAAEVLDYPIEKTIDTILHEMVHLYCRENDIKECSRNGAYHNDKFKKEAERVGLECYKTEKHGWNTKPSEKLMEYAIEHEWDDIKIGRRGMILLPSIPTTGSELQESSTEGGKRPSNTRKYICPCCGNSVRATKAINIICGDCSKRMEIAS